jgi:tetratricopeptide (TPR) repeat protein
VPDASASYKRVLADHERRDYAQAIRNYDEAIRLKPDYAMAYYSRGVAYHDEGNYDLAIQDYTEALRLKPEDARTYYNRGVAHSDNGDYAQAIRDYSEALRIQPDDEWAYENRGWAHHQREDFDQAIRDYSEAIRLDPKDANTYANRCSAYGMKRRPDQALRDCNESLRMRPSHASTLDSRALAYWLRGDQDRARDDLESARKIDPSLPTWQNRFREFEELAAGTTELEVSKAEGRDQEWPEEPLAAALSETECLSCDGTDEQATASLSDFDGKWVLEIADVDNLSDVDRQIVEVTNGKSRVEVSFNGWHGTIAMEIDIYGKLVGIGTVNGLGRESRNAPVNFVSDYDAKGFQEDVLFGNRLNSTLRIKLTRDELEASGESGKRATNSLPDFDGEWILEIREPTQMPNGDKVPVDIVDGEFTANVSANGWRGTVSGTIDRNGILVATGSLRKPSRPSALLKWSSEPSGERYIAKVPATTLWLAMTFEVSLSRSAL